MVPLLETKYLIYFFCDQHNFIYLFICFQELPEKWNNVKKLAINMKQQVAPLQANEVAILRRKCALFDVEQNKFRERFHQEAPFRWGQITAVKQWKSCDFTEGSIYLSGDKIKRSNHLYNGEAHLSGLFFALESVSCYCNSCVLNAK